MHYGRETSLLNNQWVNSYKYLHHDFYNSSYIACSQHFNQTNIQIGVCGCRDENSPQQGVRISHADAACNPYLALLSNIAAGMAGHSPDKFKVWEDDETNDTEANTKFNRAIKQHKIMPMPENLQQAIDDFEGGQLMRNILSPALIDSIIDIKRQEAEKFEKHVSSWEQQQQLEVL